MVRNLNILFGFLLMNICSFGQIMNHGMFYYQGNGGERGDVICTGGTVTDINVDGVIYRVHTFTASDTLTVVSGGIIEYLVVGGGGGVGNNNAAIGGAGGGGVLQGSSLIVKGNYPITVGAGGIGGYRATSSSAWTPAETQAENSSIGTIIVAIGGGSDGSNPTFMNGGSGGGATVYSSTLTNHGTGISGQGYDGGDGSLTRRSGGGGGADESGTTKLTTSYGGDGGDGIMSDINGIATYYGGGGGGAGDNGTASIGYGGLGGGADGINGVATSAQNGQPNTGGGAGGARYATSGRTGSGGSGIVIIRYQL